MSKGYTLHVLGSRGTHSICGKDFLEFGGLTSCYVLIKDEHAIIIDCGSGLFNAAKLLSNCTKVDIVLTHLHYDHIIGLVKATLPSSADITIYAEFNKWGGVEVLKNLFSTPFWPVKNEGIKYVDATDDYYIIGDNIKLSFHEANHPNYASIVRFDFENVSFCATIDHEATVPFPKAAVEGCKYLIFDGTFKPEEYKNHIGWGHSTWKCACDVAKEFNVSNLFIGHHEPRRTDEDLREMEKTAKEYYKNVYFLREGDVIEIEGD